MAQTSIIPRPVKRDRAKPVLRRELGASRDRSGWIETAYLSEIAAQLDRQARAVR